MIIRKGPYGHFVCDTINNDEFIVNYAVEMINAGIFKNLLPTYINEFSGSKEFNFDYSGLNAISNIKTEDKLSKIRCAIGDLFLSFPRIMDSLIPLSTLCFASDYIFADNECTTIYICCKPVFTSNSNTMQLMDINLESFTKLLQNPVFTKCLSNDERTELIYAIQTNNEQLFVNICNHIKTTEFKNSLDTSYSLTNKLISVLLLSLTSLILYKILGSIFSIFTLSVSIVLAINVYLEIKKKQKELLIKESEIITKTRTEMLFSNKTQNSTTNNCMYLISSDSSNDEINSFSIYTEKSVIGSDYFLVDIFLDDTSISPVHAEINYIDNSFYISCLSDSSITLLENTKLKYGDKYELKNNQKLLIGKYEFTIKIGTNY